MNFYAVFREDSDGAWRSDLTFLEEWAADSWVDHQLAVAGGKYRVIRYQALNAAEACLHREPATPQPSTPKEG